MENIMENMEETDHFEILEAKIDSLASYINTLKREKESLAEKVGGLEERVADLAKEVESLKASRERARQRVISLLEKIDKIAIA
ncbi:MAG: cell division protein ZapB [Deltaproteobacteria bacterium]|nr:cell division protein ZapB [Deltaproteobacteria bacterium]